MLIIVLIELFNSYMRNISQLDRLTQEFGLNFKFNSHLFLIFTQTYQNSILNSSSIQ